MTLNKVTMLRAFASANAQRLAKVVEARLVCDRVLTCPEWVCSTPAGAHPWNISSDCEDSVCGARAFGVICLTGVTRIARAAS
jgi:hypothetical protein